MSRSLAKKLAQVKPGTLYAGVDLALEWNYTMVITERAQILARFRFPHDRAGYDYFYQRLATLQERQQAPAVWVGMEPTNYFWKLLAADLEQHPAWPYRLINPYTVKRRREGDQLDNAKNDPRDAFTIADLLRTGKYTETRLLQGGYAELRQYASLHAGLEEDLTRCKNRLHELTGQLFPELREVFQDVAGLTAQALWRHGAAATVIRTLEEEQFLQQVREHFQGQRLQVTKLRAAYDRAGHSVGLAAGCQALQRGLTNAVAQLQILDQQEQQVRREFADCFLALPEAPYMLSVPSLGLLTAATILAEVGDPRHYSRIGQWVKLAGIQPVPNTSGRKSRSQTPMSHKGRPRLRKALYFAVLRLVQCDPHFAQAYQYYQQREKNPLTKMQALGALMNKLLRLLWALVKQQTFYHPASALATPAD